ncbi:class III lanthionine synthetase LanKC [Actinokineospora enzanensis]|uniref:class III lanthionine synthetase LanKC n=1 Tax=Actinokineospora enzanensis TaxID=155975 RepID=UPI00035CC5CB|nr:class III lanthionine synthetase LanKC [Actinokineospora enzanensis]
MDDYLQYCQADPDFYDHPSAGPDPRFGAAERPLPDGWTRESDGHWVYLTPDGHELPEQGWKLHVSVTAGQAEEVIDLVTGHCLSGRIAVKFLVSPRTHLLANSKYAPRGGSGKLITVYPRADELRRTLAELSVLLGTRPGPYILSDLRWGRGPLFLRFGGFRMMYCTDEQGHRVPAIRRPDGTLVPDVRGPGFTVPDWVRPPEFITDRIAMAERNGNGIPYAVEKALHFSNGGGVYLARGTDPRDRVVLREARPHAGLDATGRDAVARLRHEARVLAELSDLDFVPGNLGRFRRWEHEFLAEEYIDGETLLSFIATRNPLTGGSPDAAAVAAYTESALAVLAGVEQALDRLHERGYVFADLHPGNVIVRPDGRVALVDFEIAYRPDSQPAPTIGAPGFVAAHALAGPERDRYALNCLRLAIFLPLTPMLDLAPDKVDELVDAVAELFPVPADLIAEIRTGLRRPADRRTTPCPRPRTAELFAGDSADARDAVAESILASATPHRLDRLYPGDPAGLRDGGYNLAHGAAGVLYALHTTGQPVPEDHVDWLAAAVHRAEPQAGLYNGMHGAAVVLHALGREDDAYRIMRRLVELPDPETPGLFGGLPGIGLALRYFAARTADTYWRDALDAVTDRVVTRSTTPGSGLHLPPGTDPATAPPPQLPERHGTGRHSPAKRGPGAARAGLMPGWTGVAVFCLRRHDDTADPALLDLAGRALAADLAGSRRTDRGDVVLTDGTLALGHLAVGGAGLLEPLGRYLRHRPSGPWSEVHAGILAACRAPLTVEPGLFLGRAGLLTALAVACPGSHVTAPHIRRLSWQAVRHRQGIAFPGRWLLRLSMDLATGSAGVLLALHTATRARRTPNTPAPRGPAPVPDAPVTVRGATDPARGRRGGPRTSPEQTSATTALSDAIGLPAVG